MTNKQKYFINDCHFLRTILFIMFERLFLQQ
jgi:hypothetical protein